MVYASSSLTVMSTLAVKGALAETILPEFEASRGARITATFDPTNVLLERIARGECSSVLVAVTSAIDDLIGRRVLSTRGARPVVRTGIGVAVPDGVSLPPLRTVEDLKRCLLDAKSVAYSQTGASGVYFAGLLERLDIAKKINAAATIIPKGFAGECIIRGEADVAIQQLSELALVKGVTIAGPLPVAVQNYTEFSAAAFTEACELPFVQDLLQALHSNTAREAYGKFGLECLD